MSENQPRSVLHKILQCGNLLLPNYRNELHYKCRASNVNQKVKYNVKEKDSKEDVFRVYVPDANVQWSVYWPEYYAHEYTSPKLLKGTSYGDSEYATRITNWNTIDGKNDRRSHFGSYEIDPDSGRPLNPVGRTGISGRGFLGKWGPNHAADPIVTRWKRDKNGNIVKHEVSKKPILQFVSILRADTKEWALPGGMCDAGEKVSKTLKREFMEEATNSIQRTNEEKKQIENHLDQLFNTCGDEIYKGYVDDPRNTDNAWMETVAYNFHDGNNTIFKDFKLTAGDDATKAIWMDIDSSLKLYASHKTFIEYVARLHNAHW